MRKQPDPRPPSAPHVSHRFLGVVMTTAGAGIFSLLLLTPLSLQQRAPSENQPREISSAAEPNATDANQAADQANTKQRAQVAWKKDVQPLVKKYCHDCHGPQDPNGE
ncbi:MAG: hypothetical protein N2C14_11330, partial [Planctomycetales bacterium]